MEIENVLVSSQRANDLRALAKDALIHAADAAPDSRRLRIRIPPADAEAIGTAIFALTQSDAKLGFTENVVSAASGVINTLTEPSSDPPEMIVSVYLVFCALYLMKLALEAGYPIANSVNAVGITEAAG